MWKTLAKSVQGVGHRRGNIPCQDFCITDNCFVENHEFLIIAAADGAGSAGHSDIGSRIACESVRRVILDDLKQSGRIESVSIEQATRWFQCVLDDLHREAAAAGVAIRELACTLLVSVIGENGAAFCQIGDGAIVVKVDDKLQHVFWPQAGEYANTTNFVTFGSFDRDLMFEWREGRIDEIAVITDGLQSVALNLAKRQVHEPFFSPMFQ